MRLKIKDIGKVRAGTFAQPAAEGEIVYLQARHFDENGHLREQLYPDLRDTPAISKHLLKAGDILFGAKGTKNFACVFEEHNPKCVASTSFLIITLTDTGILPEFISWYLNNFSIMALLKARAIGSAIQSISKTVLEDLEIMVPTLESQKSILAVAVLRETEKKLRQQIETLREKQIQQQILNAINTTHG